MDDPNRLIAAAATGQPFLKVEAEIPNARNFCWRF